MQNDELYHHGIKGMKWGVRRYQNKDGSLTTAGKKKRYGMTKRQVKKAIRKSGTENRERINEESAASLDSSERFTKASRKATEIARKSSKKYSDYSELKALSLEADRESRKVGEKYAQKYKEALLKDIGYDDIMLGIEMLRNYGINPTVYDPLLSVQDKRGYIYDWNLD